MQLTLAVSAIPDLKRIVSKLAKVATKLHLSPVPSFTVDWASKVERKLTHQTIARADFHSSLLEFPLATNVGVSTSVRLIEVVKAEITLPEGGVRASGGYALIGTLDRTDAGLESTTLSAANLALVATYRDAGRMECEHCRANRRRTRTVIVQNAEGQVKQVGRECAHNYLTDVSLAIAELEFQALIVSEFSEGGDEVWGSGGGVGTLAAFDVEAALAQAALQIRLYGFQKSKSYDARSGTEIPNESATWRCVRRTLEGLVAPAGSNACRPYGLDNPAPCADDVAVAQAAAAWITGLDVGDDEFLAQLKDIVATGYVSAKKLGILCALTTAHTRAIEKQAEVLPVVPAPVGRIEVEGKIISEKQGENAYGFFHKVLVKLVDNNKVWVSYPSAATWAVGDVVKFVATFTRSDKDEHFAFGSRPSLPKPPKVRKSRASTPLLPSLVLA